jgi:DNA-binding transcriptional regulator YiaG
MPGMVEIKVYLKYNLLLLSKLGLASWLYMKSLGRTPAQRQDPAVESLIFWRRTHGLSQAETVVFFRAHLFDLTLATLKSWESSRTTPRANTRELLTRFLEQHPNPKGE